MGPAQSARSWLLHTSEINLKDGNAGEGNASPAYLFRGRIFMGNFEKLLYGFAITVFVMLFKFHSTAITTKSIKNDLLR
jgi:hypothetical protein